MAVPEVAWRALQKQYSKPCSWTNNDIVLLIRGLGGLFCGVGEEEGGKRCSSLCICLENEITLTKTQGERGPGQLRLPEFCSAANREQQNYIARP